MNSAITALLPVFLLIAVGYALRYTGVPGEGFWAPAERLTYYVFFPALLIFNLGRAPLAGQPIAPLAAALALAVVTLSLLLLLSRRVLGLSGPAFTSLFQGSIRFNTYIGIAAASALYGAAGLTLAAISMAILIPLINVLCVAVLTRWCNHGRAAGTQAVLLGILRNPLVIACATGIALNLTKIGVPAPLDGVLEILGRAALPMGLLAVGAGLNLRSLRQAGGAMALSCVTKLGAMPALMFLTTHLMGLPTTATAIAVLFAALPGATSAYILARQLGGDYELVAGMVTLQTGLAVITLPVTLSLLTYL